MDKEVQPTLMLGCLVFLEGSEKTTFMFRFLHFFLAFILAKFYSLLRLTIILSCWWMRFYGKMS